ncbi:MAG: nitrate reductase molybdenum cofactor assembly chaperone [Hyphomicrobium sp.]|nr:nitrate reductase molybdenum cofactor assembly chaperone [Hyphomicrobium sp.]
MTTRTFKVLSALLSYPTAELQGAAGELQTVLDEEGLVPIAQRDDLALLIEELAGSDLYDLEERYVLLFDRTRSLSLHLFEHVHGEGRDRGQAMVDLKSLYEKEGLCIGTRDLPDFLPVFLEFLSLRPRAEAFELLAQPAHIFTALAERLHKRQSPYEPVFRVLVALAAAPPSREAVSELLKEADPDAMDLAALDAAWEDEPVTFGPGSGSGCKDELIARIRAGRRPAPGIANAPAKRPEISRP